MVKSYKKLSSYVKVGYCTCSCVFASDVNCRKCGKPIISVKEIRAINKRK